MGIEIELKLGIAPEDSGRVETLPAVAAHMVGSPETLHLVNRYFDTLDGVLRDSKVGLRLRLKKGQWLQTLKCDDPMSGGIARRREWEMPVAGEALELERFTDPAARAVLQRDDVRGRLAPCFVTDFSRRVLKLALPDGTTIELAVDTGEVRAGEAAAPIAEVELELESGDPARVFEVARAINAAVPLRLERRSKAERGYALCTPPAPPAGSKAGAVRLADEMDAEKALAAILGHTLDHWLRNEPVVRDNPTDVEGVHQMRVASRRFRSCLRLHRPLLGKASVRRVSRRIKWLTDALGPARDWDVLLDETLDPLLALTPDHPALAALVARAESRRAAAYESAQAALASSDYTDLVLETAGWVEGRGWRDELEAEARGRLDQPARAFAAAVLEQGDARVAKDGSRFAKLSEEERHELRIRMKQLRYAADFFADLWDRETARAFSKSLGRLQDVLGALNDVAVSRALLGEVAAGADDPGLERVLGWKAAVVHRQLADFGAAWKAFKGQGRYWR